MWAIRRGVGILMLVGATICSVASIARDELDRSEPLVLVTSRHAVYAVNEPIDLTVWIKSRQEATTFVLEVKDKLGRLIRRRDSMEREPAGEVIGPVGPGGNALVAIPDLRRQFDVDKPGRYTAIVREAATGAAQGNRALPYSSLEIRVLDQVTRGSIPLRQVWALDMPGTRPMNRIQDGNPPVYRAPEGRLVDEVRARLSADSAQHATAGTGFAVRGQGMDALREAHGILVNGRKRMTKFRANEPISVVFYTRESSSYVVLEAIEQRATTIEIRYRLVPHRTKELTSHLAIIPLPAHARGAIRVEPKPLIDEDSARLDWSSLPQRIVSSAFQLILAN